MSTVHREWLIMLETTAGAMADLLALHGGSLASAAHELATARLRCRYTYEVPPSAAELWVAAAEVAERAGWIGSIPGAHSLARECRLIGLLVTGTGG